MLFDAPPARPELRYEIRWGGDVRGLRVLGGAVELLDASGTPRFHMSPPSMLDAKGLEHPLAVDVEGCAVDRDPRPPWGRAPVAPGAASCSLVLRWELPASAYPILIDPAWSFAGAMLHNRSGHTASLLPDGHVLVVGGAPETTDAELYDPASNTWAATGSLQVPRSHHTATSLKNGDVLIAGGNVAGGSAELYQAAAGTFRTLPDMLYAHTNHAATLLGTGDVLVVGGSNSSGSYNPNAVAEYFSPSQETWFNVPGQSVFYETLTTLADGRALLVGGDAWLGQGVSIPDIAQLFAPVSKTWSPAGQINRERFSHTATLLPSGKVLIVGGVNGSAAVMEPELWDPSTSSFSVGQTMSVARTGHAATSVPGGNVLVVGGTDSAAGSLWDVLASQWVGAGGMAQARSGATATLLKTGLVLVAGGGQNPLAELFDPGAAHAGCGDGLVSQTEDCDGLSLAGATCQSLAYASGKLRCNDVCSFDTSGCSGTTGSARCGDGIVQPGEGCDDGAHNGSYGWCDAQCAALGPHRGDGICTAPMENCLAVPEDCGSCPGSGSVCGDGKCDTDTETCLSCPGDCQGCCGNGVIDPGEQCDGEQLGRETCERFGKIGDLKCTNDCRWDMQSCCTGVAPVGPSEFDIGIAPQEFELPLMKLTLGVDAGNAPGEAGECKWQGSLTAYAELCFNANVIQTNKGAIKKTVETNCPRVAITAGLSCDAVPVCEAAPGQAVCGPTCCTQKSTVGFTLNDHWIFEAPLELGPDLGAKASLDASLAFGGAVSWSQTNGPSCACKGTERAASVSIVGKGNITGSLEYDYFGLKHGVSVEGNACAAFGIEEQLKCNGPDAAPIGGVSLSITAPEIDLKFVHFGGGELELVKLPKSWDGAECK